MNYSEIVVTLGNKCTAQCEICCLDANMSCNTIIDVPRIKDFLLSAEQVKQIHTIHFSGGEAFLYYDTLVELVRLCSSIKKKTTVITNGFWAKNKETVDEKLRVLKEAGLFAIGTSYDEYHQKYVSVESIRNLIVGAKKVGLKTSIQAVVVRDSQNGDWIDTLGEDLADVAVDFITCDKAGKAKKNILDSQFIRKISSEGCVCRKGASFSILYDGSLWPCCAPSVFETGLSVGNIYNDIKTVKNALTQLEKSPVLKVLRNKGFDFYKEIMEEHELVAVPDKVISSCELCQLFFGREQMKQLEPYIIEKISKDPNCIIRRKQHEI